MFIGRSLVSALNQSYNNFEIVLINDGSTDNSLSVVNEIIANNKKKNEILIINHSKNKGVSSARNTGIKNATGKYIYFLDSDDEMSLNSLEILSFNIKEKNIDIVIGNYTIVGTTTTKHRKIECDEIIENNEDIFNSFLTYKWYDGTANKLINKNFLNTNHIHFYEGIVYEDTLWSFEIATKASSLVLSSKNTYVYHLRPDSITHNINERNLNSMLFIMASMRKTVITNKLYINHVQIFNYFADLRFHFYKLLIKSKGDDLSIKKMILKVNDLFSESIFNNYFNYSITSLLKLIPYKIPFYISLKLMRFLYS